MLKNFYAGWLSLKEDNKGIGTIEMILILVVLIGLVIIFKNQLNALITSIFSKITAQSGMI